MKSLNYSIKLTAPTIISGTSGDSVTNTCLSYIPGTTILGMLAGRYLQQYKADSEFERLFLRGGLLFRNLYLQKDKLSYIPCPKNIFQNKKDEKDIIILNEDTINNAENLLEYKEVISYVNIRDSYIKLQKPEFCMNFHHQRNYATGIPEENVVFNYEALKPDQIFAGKIIGEEKDLQLISELLKEKEVRIGKSKTAQYGNAIIIDSHLEDLPALKDFPTPIYLYCASDLILLNEFGFPVTTVKEIEKILGVHILEAYTEIGRTESTITAWKAQKPSYYTLKAGSIFLLEKLPENYQDIQIFGLGERTWEGFGQVEFKYCKQLKYIETESSSFKNKPEQKIPDILISILEKTYQNNFLNYVRKEAIIDADDVKDYQKVTKSLVSKLEGFANYGNFGDLLKQLNKTAIDKLNRVYIEFQGKEENSPRLFNLNEFLNPTNLNYKISLIRNKFSVIGKNHSSAKLKEEFAFKEIDDEEATKVYLINFFWFLRKKLAVPVKKEEQ